MATKKRGLVKGSKKALRAGKRMAATKREKKLIAWRQDVEFRKELKLLNLPNDKISQQLGVFYHSAN